MNIRSCFALLSLLVLSLALPTARGAESISLTDTGFVIETSSGSKLKMPFPVLVNAAKAKAKIAEKSVSGNHATIKFEGGGALEIDVAGAQATFKPADVPEGTKFFSSGIHFDLPTYVGGKWKFAGKEGELPKEKTPQPQFHQGNGNGITMTTAAGVTTSLQLPGNSYEQIMDGRHFTTQNYIWQYFVTYQPGMTQWTLKLGAAPAETKVAEAKPAAPPKPAEPDPVVSKAEGTEITKWKDGKRAVFMLAFDDSAPTQLKNVVPELIKRKIPGTFYLVTGNSLWEGLKTKWTEAVQSEYIVPANHTFTHKGMEDPSKLDDELGKCNEVLYALHPNRKVPRLLGFGQPGGVPWIVPKDAMTEGLKKHYLVNRPPFYGPPMHYNSAAACVAAIDTAISKGEMGHLDFHGVGGDWLTTPVDWFTAILDKLEASRDQVWVTDTVSWHQYVTERKNTSLTLLQNDAKGIRLGVACPLDSNLYNLPLTFVTKVPAGWVGAVVTQGKSSLTIPVKDGAVTYSALPSGGEIAIKQAGVTAAAAVPAPVASKPAAAAPSTGDKKTIFSVYVGNNADLVPKYEAWLGKPTDAILSYTGDKDWKDYDGSVGWAMGLWSKSDRPVLWSVALMAKGSTLEEAAKGAYNDHYRKAAQKLAKWRPQDPVIYIRTGWEFNGGWFHYRAVGKPEAFIGAWRQFVDTFRSVSDRFRFDWCPAGGDNFLPMNAEDAYPGDEYVDVIGLDIYDQYRWQKIKDPAERWQKVFMDSRNGLKWHRDFAKKHGKPMAYSEWGCGGNEAGDNPYFVEQMHKWFVENNVLYASYWNSNAGYKGLLSDGSYPNSGQKYRELFGPAAATARK